MQQCQQGNVKMRIFLVSAGDAERKVQSEPTPENTEPRKGNAT